MAQDRHHILVICTGNTCRSPMAAKLLQHALAGEKAPLDKIVVESAGVAAAPGEPASGNSVAALKKVNIDLSPHKSQPVTQALIDRARVILGMTSSHLDALHFHNVQNLPEHVHLFREFINATDGKNQIPDPFGQDFDTYQQCLDAMVEAIPSLVAFIRKLYTERKT